MAITLATLLKDSAYKLTQFKPAQIAVLEAAISFKAMLIKVHATRG